MIHFRKSNGLPFFFSLRDSGVIFRAASLRNYVRFTPKLLYSSTKHSQEGIIQLRTG